MKKFISNAFNALSSSRTRGSRSVSALAVGVLAIFLVACGGGGGGTSAVTPPPIACPAGGTSASADSCAKVTGSTGLADGVTVETLTKTGFATTTIGSIQPPNGDTTKLYLGATEVGATIPLTFSDITSTSFTTKVGTGLQPFTTYTYVANLTDGILRPFKIVKTFTTGGTVCPAPAMANSLGTCMSPPVANAIWNSAMKAWAYPAGMLVVGLNTLPAACVTIGDACWTAKIADGTIKLVSTNAAMTGYSTRPVVFAVYKTFDGYNNQMPLYVDVIADTPFASKLVWNSGGMQTVTDVKGSDNGIKITYPDYGCYERVHTGGGNWGNVKLGSCPI